MWSMNMLIYVFDQGYEEQLKANALKEAFSSALEESLAFSVSHMEHPSIVN